MKGHIFWPETHPRYVDSSCNSTKWMIYREADCYMELRPSGTASSQIEHARPAELKTAPCQLW